jgi:hypothetical protein
LSNDYQYFNGSTRAFGTTTPLSTSYASFLARATATGQWEWAVALTANHSRNSGKVLITGITTSPAGDVYIAGTALGELYIGGAYWGTNNSSQSLLESGFVACLNAQGVCRWVRYQDHFNRPQLAFDPSTGGVVMASQYYRAATNSSIPLPDPGTNKALYVARLSQAGQVLAVTTALGATAGVEVGKIDVSPTGQVLLSGTKTAGTFSFGPHTLTSTNNKAFVVAQLSPANQWNWALTSTSNTGSSAATAVRYSPTGLWVSGTGSDGATVGPAVLTSASPNGFDQPASFVGRLSASGQWQMAQAVIPDATGAVSLRSIGTDSTGNAVVLGSLYGRVSLGSQALSSSTFTSSYFTARLSDAGQWQQVAAVAPAGVSWPVNDGTFDAANNLYLTGTFEGPLTLGPSQLLGSGLQPGSSGPIRWQCGDVVLAQMGRGTLLPSRPAAPSLALSCFPNPAHGRATLHLPAPAATAQPVAVLDALGRPVRHYTLPARATDTTLDLTGLTPGLYVLRCGAATERLLVE